MSMIKIENLTFSYPTSYDNIFEDVNIQIDTDWKLGFVGRNGRGKTTLLNLLLGKYEYSGKIHTTVQFDYFPYSVADKSEFIKENFMKRMLVTGGTTFVSKYVAEYFVNAGYEVFVLNRNSKPQVQGVKLIQGDRHNLGGVLKDTFFDVVADITAYNDKDIIDFVKELGSFDQYIMISSSAVYPEYGVQPFLEESEKSENKFWGSYGTDKIAAEKALLERVKDAYILRPPYLYGPMNNVYREAFVFDCAMADRKFYLPQDGSMKLQFFHVKDLCRLMEVIIKEKPEEHILNVGNVETVSIKDWVTKCYESLGKIPEFVNVYEEIEQRNYFSFYNYEYYLDVSRQSKIYPETTSLEDGLRDSVKWYLKHSAEVNKKPYFEYINENFVES